MMDRLQALIAELGCKPTTADAPFNLSFRRPNFVEFFPDSKRSVVVKIAPGQSVTAAALEREYTTLRGQNRAIAELIPAPLALRTIGDQKVLVLEGVSHGPAVLHDLVNDGRGAALLGEFLAGTYASSGLQQEPPMPFDAATAYLPEDLRRSVSAVALARDWAAWQRSLPSQPQHSDLAINNLGRTATGFVVFDWEDYGRTSLPGFDLSILVCSACAFHMDRVRETFESLARRTCRQDCAIARAVARLPVAAERLIDVFVASLVFFHALKRMLGYDDEVILRCQRNLSDALAWIRSAPPARA